MSLLQRNALRALCRKYDIRPSKRFGQNFLLNAAVLQKMIRVGEIAEDDGVLEVGPGFGALTFVLSQHTPHVVAIERDKRLCAALRGIQEEALFKLVCSDVFDISNAELLHALGTKTYKLISNLPYAITSSVLRKFLEEEPKPSSVVVCVQREVGERICAGPGRQNILALSVQLFGTPKIVCHVSRHAFWPEPAVDSVVLSIQNIQSNASIEKRFDVSVEDFFCVVKHGFSARRKQLQNNLIQHFPVSREAIGEVFEGLSLSRTVRAQELSVNHWMKIAQFLRQLPP